MINLIEMLEDFERIVVNSVHDINRTGKLSRPTRFDLVQFAKKYELDVDEIFERFGGK